MCFGSCQGVGKPSLDRLLSQVHRKCFPARISRMYCILSLRAPRWTLTPQYMSAGLAPGYGPRSIPIMTGRSYKALRERGYFCARGLAIGTAKREVSGVLGLGSKGTSRVPRESSSVRLVRSYSDRVACGRLACSCPSTR
jgi:hypothetical protein